MSTRVRFLYYAQNDLSFKDDERRNSSKNEQFLEYLMVFGHQKKFFFFFLTIDILPGSDINGIGIMQGVSLIKSCFKELTFNQ